MAATVGGVGACQCCCMQLLLVRAGGGKAQWCKCCCLPLQHTCVADIQEATGLSALAIHREGVADSRLQHHCATQSRCSSLEMRAGGIQPHPVHMFAPSPTENSRPWRACTGEVCTPSSPSPPTDHNSALPCCCPKSDIHAITPTSLLYKTEPTTQYRS